MLNYDILGKLGSLVTESNKYYPESNELVFNGMISFNSKHKYLIQCLYLKINVLNVIIVMKLLGNHVIKFL
jgi:hypothetical protein